MLLVTREWFNSQCTTIVTFYLKKALLCRLVELFAFNLSLQKFLSSNFDWWEIGVEVYSSKRKGLGFVWFLVPGLRKIPQTVVR